MRRPNTGSPDRTGVGSPLRYAPGMLRDGPRNPPSGNRRTP